MVGAGLLDLVFPPICVSCQRAGSLFCSQCWQESVFPPQGTAPTIEDVDGFYALAAHDGAIRDALHALKYEGVRGVATPLAASLAKNLPWTFEAIIPVPLHYARLRERGYNQANILAQALSLQTGCPVLEDALVRHKMTRSQVGLNGVERRVNVADAFRVKVPIPQTVLLIDDVCTTGATLGAAAQALKGGGATTLYAATVSLAS